MTIRAIGLLVVALTPSGVSTPTVRPSASATPPQASAPAVIVSRPQTVATRTAAAPPAAAAAAPRAATSGWTFKREVDLVDLLKTLLGFLVAWYVKWYLERRIEYMANLRGLVTKCVTGAEERMAKIETECAELRSGVAISPELQQKLATFFKSLSIATSYAASILAECEVENAYGVMTKFQTNVLLYKRLLTGRDTTIPLTGLDIGAIQEVHARLSTMLTTVTIRILQHKKPTWYRKLWAWIRHRGLGGV